LVASTSTNVPSQCVVYQILVQRHEGLIGSLYLNHSSICILLLIKGLPRSQLVKTKYCRARHQKFPNCETLKFS
jgi:hypothetical protein